MDHGPAQHLSSSRDDDKGDICIAKNSDLLGLLEQPAPSFRIRRLSIREVLDPFYLYLPSPHLFFLLLLLMLLLLEEKNW